MISTEQLKQTVNAFFDALAAADAERIVSFYAEDGECWTSGNTLISGTLNREQILAGASAVLDVFPDKLSFGIDGMTAEGLKVAVEARSEGMHISGQRYRNFYHFLFEFNDDGKLRRLKEYMDTEAVTDVLCGGQRP